LYGKVFDSIYDGTLYGHWEAIVTMQQLIVLASPDGVVDMTPQAIAARTSIPLDIISKGLKVLSEPDPYTRTPGEDGKRIVLMDEHRPWGWRLVNHGKYMRLRNMAQKREADRARIADKRNKNKDVAIVSQPVANVAHSDSDLDKDLKKKLAPPYSGAFLRFWGVWPKSNRKGSQGECWEKWRKRDYDQIADHIIAHVEHLKHSSDWQKDGGAFIPAPLAYLNKRRWEGAEDDQPFKVDL
jgi:hypothetical protein